MKRFMILLVFAILTFNLMAQKADSLYSKGLELHLEYLEALHKGRSINTYFVESDDQITYNLPRTVDDLVIEYLDKEAIKKKGKHSQFHLIVIQPLEIKEDKIEISVIDYLVDYKRRNFNYANSGGSKLIFKYDCKTELYVLHKKHQGGI